MPPTTRKPLVAAAKEPAAPAPTSPSPDGTVQPPLSVTEASPEDAATLAEADDDAETDDGEFVTRAEFDALREELNALRDDVAADRDANGETVDVLSRRVGQAFDSIFGNGVRPPLPELESEHTL